MNNNFIKVDILSHRILVMLEEARQDMHRTGFNRKPDLTYDLETVLAKLNINAEA